MPEGDFSAERRLRGTDWPVSLKESTYPKAVELYRYHLEWMTAREREAVHSRTVQKVWPFGL